MTRTKLCKRTYISISIVQNLYINEIFHPLIKYHFTQLREGNVF